MSQDVQQIEAPSALRLVLGLAAVVGVACGAVWLLRGDVRATHDKVAGHFAELCPRWVRLAEDLIPINGTLAERCELIQGGDSVFRTSYSFKAAPNVLVDVYAKDSSPSVPDSVEIRDIDSKATVTYNAEALALLK